MVLNLILICVFSNTSTHKHIPIHIRMDIGSEVGLEIDPLLGGHKLLCARRRAPAFAASSAAPDQTFPNQLHQAIQPPAVLRGRHGASHDDGGAVSQ